MPRFKNKISLLSASLIFTLGLTACGSGSSDHSSSIPTSPTNPKPTEPSIPEPTEPTKPNPPESIQCLNGIPQNLKTSGSGFFNEEWYTLDVTDREEDERDVVVFNTNTLKSGTWVEKITNSIEGSPKQLALEYHYDADFLLTPSKLDSALKRSSTNNGIPIGYIIAQNGDNFTFNHFTDDCNIHKENQLAQRVKRIDISGKTVADLFKFYQYGNSEKAIRYISEDINSTLRVSLPVYEKLSNDQTRFPAGSVISYVDQSIASTPIISFDKDDIEVEYKTLNDYKADNPLKTGYSWKDAVYGGYSVVYPIHTSSGANAELDDDADPAVLMNNKVYEAEWVIEGDSIQREKDRNRSEDFDMKVTYFNKVAMQSFANAINSSGYPTSK